jgi:hypothetical protein
MATQLVEPGRRAALEAVAECSEVCEGCGQACIKSGDASMAACISICLDCAVVCRSCETLLTRNSRFDVLMCKVVAEIAEACADECAKCDSPACGCDVCAGAAHRCAEECTKLAAG